LAVALALSTSSAAASTRTELEALQAAWRAYPTQHRVGPRLLSQNQPRPVELPFDPTAEATLPCVTLVVLSSPSTQLRLVPTSPDVTATDMAEIAGGLQMTRCGQRRGQFRHVAIEALSPRAVVELLWVESNAPLSPLERYLKERRRGPSSSSVSDPPHRDEATMSQRLDQWNRGSHLRMGLDRSQKTLASDPSGRGHVELALAQGCHRLHLLSESTGTRDARIDVDAAIDLQETGRRLEDRRTLASPTLTFCLLAPSQGEVSWQGDAPSGSVTLIHERYRLPVGLPEAWPDFARERLAEALFDAEESGEFALGAAVYQALVPGGLSVFPIVLPENTCVLAALAPLSDGPERMGLALQTATRTQDYLARERGGVAILATCREHSELGYLQTSAGDSGGWVMGVFTVQRPTSSTP